MGAQKPLLNPDHYLNATNYNNYIRMRPGNNHVERALKEVMSLVRALLARFVRNKPRLQEELDVSQLYHLLKFHLEGKESTAKDPKLKDVSYYEQLQLVNTAVTQQVT